MSCIQVCGVQGVGKSTITNHLRERIPLCVVKDYADFILELESAKDKDSINNIPMSGMELIYAEADEMAIKFKKALNGRVFIMESHLSVIRNGNIQSVVDIPFFKSMGTVGLILIQADASSINFRRQHDKSRKRMVEDIAFIQRHQSVNRSIANAVAQELGINLKIIDNRSGEMTNISKEISTWAKSIGLI